MEIQNLIEQLSRPEAYSSLVESVEVHQTHISAVFLAGPHAYKVKKPVRLDYLDYGTLESRRHYAHEEVRLNRRLAPDVYLGVVPIVETPSGVRVEAPGEPIEWAVKMERLPDGATLRARLERDEVEPDDLERLARLLARFHREADGGPRVAEYGRFPAVRGIVEENLEVARRQVGITIHPDVEARLGSTTRAALAHQHVLIERRAERGVPRDTHGDLRLDHVYAIPGRGPGGDFVIVDCIEFNERFRYSDPVCDAAFLAMDLASRGRHDLADAFRGTYIEASGDVEGQALWPLYISYRSAVRAKVAVLRATAPEVPEEDRIAASRRARAHWLCALESIESPDRRPGLVLIGGLPGSGKSTLATAIAERWDFAVIRSDEERKVLAGLDPRAPASAPYKQGIYTPESTRRTYASCSAKAESALTAGRRVIVDASFIDDDRRRDFLELADGLGLRAVFLLCQADPRVIHQRLAARRDDPSDADRTIYEQARRRWVEPGARTRRSLTRIRTDEESCNPLDAVQEALRRAGLCKEGDPSS